MTTQPTLFEGARLQMTDSIRLTVESLQVYGEAHEHWAIAFSGGKDSSALVTLVTWLILSGRVKAPRTLTVLYADTRLELPPLWLSAQTILGELVEHAPALAALGCTLDVRTVMAPLDKRFLVYVLGRGVPPPNNNTLRWCTRQIKVDPMRAELARLMGDRGDVLTLTGVRMGESAARDARIALSCSKGDGECGQSGYCGRGGTRGESAERFHRRGSAQPQHLEAFGELTDPTSQLRHEREGHGEHVDESANGAAEEVEEVVAAALAEDGPDKAAAAIDPEGDGVEGSFDGADTGPDAASKGFASGLTGMLELGGEAGEFAPLEDEPIGLLAEDERVLLGDGVERFVHPVGVDDGVAQLDLLNPSRLGDKPLLGGRHPLLSGGDLLLLSEGDLRQLATAFLGKLLLRHQHPLLLGGPDLRRVQCGLLVGEPLLLGLGAVAPDDAIGLGQLGHLGDPGEEPGVAGEQLSSRIEGGGDAHGLLPIPGAGRMHPSRARAHHGGRDRGIPSATAAQPFQPVAVAVAVADGDRA